MANSNDQVIPEWNHPVLPGNAVQGMVPTAASDFTDPPSSSAQIQWVKQEDYIGTASIKLEWDEENNIYSLYMATGHRDAEGTWSYTWTLVGTITGLSAEAEAKIRQLTYASYAFETTSTSLKVTGTKLDGTTEVLCDCTFPTQEWVNTNFYNKTEINAKFNNTETVDVVLQDGSIKTLTFIKPQS